jgi:hypothetical protein
MVNDKFSRFIFLKMVSRQPLADHFSFIFAQNTEGVSVNKFNQFLHALPYFCPNFLTK